MVVKLRAGTLSVGHQITNKRAAGETGLCHTFRALNETFKKEICGLTFMLLFWNDQKKKMDVYVVIILLISPLFFLPGSVTETQAVKIRWIEMINDENR